MRPDLHLSSLPTGVLVIVIVLAVAELVLDLIALASLARRPRPTVVFGNKWVWLAIIVLVNPIGAILYLAIGRIRAPAAQDAPPAVSDRTPAISVADALYGENTHPDGR